MISIIPLFLLIGAVYGNFFNFFQNQFQRQQPEGQVQNPEEYENHVLNTRCSRYLCPETGICVDSPKMCPCPFPSSQLRCFLPDGRYVCISKPAGDQFGNVYDDPKSNWKVDAKDDNVRDCGWVNRAYKGLV